MAEVLEPLFFTVGDGEKDYKDQKAYAFPDSTFAEVDAGTGNVLLSVRAANRSKVFPFGGPCPDISGNFSISVQFYDSNVDLLSTVTVSPGARNAPRTFNFDLDVLSYAAPATSRYFVIHSADGSSLVFAGPNTADRYSELELNIEAVHLGLSGGTVEYENTGPEIRATSGDGLSAAERAKLAAIEERATRDQTGTEIVSAIDTQLGSTDWKTGGGAPAFTGLTDTPSSYSGEGGKLVAVNSGASGLEFIDAPSGSSDSASEGATFGGALVSRTSNTGSQTASQFNTIVWQRTEYEKGEWWTSSAATRFTVPSGIGRIQIVGSIRAHASGSGEMALRVIKNGNFAVGTGQASGAISSAVAGQITVTTAVLEVSSGDYFELQAFGTVAYTIQSDRSFFSIETAGSGSNVPDKPDTPSKDTEYNLQIESDGTTSWVEDTGGGTFTSLTDTPSAYTGEGGKFLAVNSGASAVEFVDAPSGGTGGTDATARAAAAAAQATADAAAVILSGTRLPMSNEGSDGDWWIYGGENGTLLSILENVQGTWVELSRADYSRIEIDDLRHLTRDLHTPAPSITWIDALDSDGDMYQALASSTTPLTDANFNNEGASLTIATDASTQVYVRLPIGVDHTDYRIAFSDGFARSREGNLWTVPSYPAAASTTYQYWRADGFTNYSDGDVKLQKRQSTLDSTFFDGRLDGKALEPIDALQHLTRDIHVGTTTTTWSNVSDSDADLFWTVPVAGEITLTDANFNNQGASITIPASNTPRTTYVFVRLPAATNHVPLRLMQGSHTQLANTWGLAADEGVTIPSGDTYQYWLAEINLNETAALTIQLQIREDVAHTRYDGTLGGEATDQINDLMEPLQHLTRDLHVNHQNPNWENATDDLIDLYGVRTSSEDTALTDANFGNNGAVILIASDAATTVFARLPVAANYLRYRVIFPNGLTLTGNSWTTVTGPDETTYQYWRVGSVDSPGNSIVKAQFHEVVLEDTTYTGSGSIPTGGTTGQALVKSSGDSYDVEWGNVAAGDGGGSGGGSLTTIYEDESAVVRAADTWHNLALTEAPDDNSILYIDTFNTSHTPSVTSVPWVSIPESDSTLLSGNLTEGIRLVIEDLDSSFSRSSATAISLRRRTNGELGILHTSFANVRYRIRKASAGGSSSGGSGGGTITTLFEDTTDTSTAADAWRTVTLSSTPSETDLLTVILGGAGGEYTNSPITFPAKLWLDLPVITSTATANLTSPDEVLGFPISQPGDQQLATSAESSVFVARVSNTELSILTDTRPFERVTVVSSSGGGGGSSSSGGTTSPTVLYEDATAHTYDHDGFRELTLSRAPAAGTVLQFTLTSAPNSLMSNTIYMPSDAFLALEVPNSSETGYNAGWPSPGNKAWLGVAPAAVDTAARITYSVGGNEWSHLTFLFVRRQSNTLMDVLYTFDGVDRSSILKIEELPNGAASGGGSSDGGEGVDATARAAAAAAELDAAAAQATADAALSRSGGTMTGKITLDGAPTVDLHAATKKYVDDSIGSGGDSGGDGGSSGGGGELRYASVSYSANTSATGTFAVAPNWTSENADVGDWFESSSANRFTVPAGVRRVRLHASIRANSLGSTLTTYIRHVSNGTTTTIATAQGEPSTNSAIFTMSTPILDVDEGDYFQLWKFSSDSAFSFPTTMNFSIWEVGATGGGSSSGGGGGGFSLEEIGTSTNAIALDADTVADTGIDMPAEIGDKEIWVLQVGNERYDDLSFFFAQDIVTGNGAEIGDTLDPNTNAGDNAGATIRAKRGNSTQSDTLLLAKDSNDNIVISSSHSNLDPIITLYKIASGGSSGGSQLKDLDTLPDVASYETGDLIAVEENWYKLGVTDETTANLFSGEVGRDVFNNTAGERWRGISSSQSPNGFSTDGEFTANPDNTLTLLLASSARHIRVAMKRSVYEAAKGSTFSTSDHIAIRVTMADGSTTDEAVLAYYNSYERATNYIIWQHRHASDNYNLYSEAAGNEVTIEFFTTSGSPPAATTTPLFTHTAGLKHWLLWPGGEDPTEDGRTALSLAQANAARIDALDMHVDGVAEPMHSLTYNENTALLAPLAGSAGNFAVSQAFNNILTDDLLVIDWRRCDHLNHHDEYVVPGSDTTAGRMYLHPRNFDNTEWNGEFVYALDRAIQDNGSADPLNSWIVGSILYSGSTLTFGLHLQQGGTRANRNLMPQAGFSLTLRIYRNSARSVPTSAPFKGIELGRLVGHDSNHLGEQPWTSLATGVTTSDGPDSGYSHWLSIPMHNYLTLPTGLGIILEMSRTGVTGQFSQIFIPWHAVGNWDGRGTSYPLFGGSWKSSGTSNNDRIEVRGRVNAGRLEIQAACGGADDEGTLHAYIAT